ncbi:hypothetical protein [Jannaschia sp. R86511]|uniref:hypothetical protein n=1 Tax=Jannaschia sp. R86511 TaxID=3093853 RepID=UPI0036D23B59
MRAPGGRPARPAVLLLSVGTALGLLLGGAAPALAAVPGTGEVAPAGEVLHRSTLTPGLAVAADCSGATVELPLVGPVTWWVDSATGSRVARATTVTVDPRGTTGLRAVLSQGAVFADGGTSTAWSVGPGGDLATGCSSTPPPPEPVPPTTTPSPVPPATAGPVPAKPVPPKPVPPKPAPVKPVPVKPVPVKPVPVKPVPAEPAPVKPVPTEPAPTEPAPAEPVPTKPAVPSATERPEPSESGEPSPASAGSSTRPSTGAGFATPAAARAEHGTARRSASPMVPAAPVGPASVGAQTRADAAAATTGTSPAAARGTLPGGTADVRPVAAADRPAADQPVAIQAVAAPAPALDPAGPGTGPTVGLAVGLLALLLGAGAVTVARRAR